MVNPAPALRFELSNVPLIRFGAGVSGDAAPLARSLGRRCLVVTGRNPVRAQPLLADLARAGVAATVFPVAGEPTIVEVAAGVQSGRAAAAEVVIGWGGGSALDAAKAIAGLLGNGGAPLDYLEVVGAGRPLERPALPWIAVPTTAGTGAEVTRNAVLAVPEHRVKASLRSVHLLARAALVDPLLTHDLPPAVTAATGLDALTQLIEPYVTPRATPLTDGFCAQGIPRAARALQRAWMHGHDAAAREDLALASLLGGLALSQAGLGAVHGLAAPLGGQLGAPHGAVCAALLAPVMAANLAALRARAPGHPALDRYREVAVWLTGEVGATADDGVAWVRALVRDLGIPPLGRHGLDEASLETIAAEGLRASSMKANPVALTIEELVAALRAAS